MSGNQKWTRLNHYITFPINTGEPDKKKVHLGGKLSLPPKHVSVKGNEHRLEKNTITMMMVTWRK